MGFNVCMVARNEKKMKEKLQEVVQAVPESDRAAFQCKSVVADFGTMTTIDQYFKLAEQFKDLDVAMVYLNAGYCMCGPLEM